MSRVVKIQPNVDYRKLPLTPVEGSVFLKIDGALSEAELVSVTGFHRETVKAAIDRFIELGAVRLVDHERDQVERVAKAATGLAFGGELGKGHLDESILSEDVELEPARKRMVLDAFQRLDALNYYELLGLHQLVDRKEIKAAYFAVAPDFHPDRFFKRKLGSYKMRIEAIFARLTLAHDTLSSKAKRAEYDEYLSTLGPKIAQRPWTEPPPAAPSEPPNVEVDAKQQLLAERRRMLAAKLGGGARPGANPKSPSRAPQASPDDARKAAEALRVRFEYARGNAARSQLDGYISLGRSALVQQDFAGASNFFRIAQSLAPDDAELEQEAREVFRQASIALAENFAKVGEYEFSQEKWADAAVNLQKACAGRPDDARLHDKAAQALLRGKRQVKRAVELSRRAVELQPRSVPFRLTLATAFAAAGLESSCNAEIARATELAGKEDRMVGLIHIAKETTKAYLKTFKESESERPPARPNGTQPKGQPAPIFPPSAPLPTGVGPEASVKTSEPAGATTPAREPSPSLSPGAARFSRTGASQKPPAVNVPPTHFPTNSVSPNSFPPLGVPAPSVAPASPRSAAPTAPPPLASSPFGDSASNPPPGDFRTGSSGAPFGPGNTSPVPSNYPKGAPAASPSGSPVAFPVGGQGGLPPGFTLPASSGPHRGQEPPFATRVTTTEPMSTGSAATSANNRPTAEPPPAYVPPMFAPPSASARPGPVVAPRIEEAGAGPAFRAAWPPPALRPSISLPAQPQPTLPEDSPTEPSRPSLPPMSAGPDGFFGPRPAPPSTKPPDPPEPTHRSGAYSVVTNPRTKREG